MLSSVTWLHWLRLCVFLVTGIKWFFKACWTYYLPFNSTHPPTNSIHPRVNQMPLLTSKLLPECWLTIIELPSSLLAFTRLRAVLWSMSNTVSFHTQRNKKRDTCIRQGKLAARSIKIERGTESANSPWEMPPYPSISTSVLEASLLDTSHQFLVQNTQ